ncbi:MAG: sulfatase-like hydrolase/transferase [Rhodobacteraceae bacterium]|nr:sulfatase-like hydrolase/transferase [Paracoccaceae bacterium]
MTNLLILMSDEHQARAMGCAGHPFVRTPNLDALAAQGVRFTRAYTPSPICVPARAAFAAGRPVHETRRWDNAMPYRGNPPGWGHALQQRGVAVESIGKLHYRDPSDAAGFDHEHIPMMVANGTGMVWASIRAEGERLENPGRMLGQKFGAGESTYTEYDRAVTARASDWLAERGARQDRQPWCLFVGLCAPHFPLIAPPEFYDLYPPGLVPEPKLQPRHGHPRHPWVEKLNAHMDSEAQFRDPDERMAALRAYHALCTWMDHNVGRILAALRASGMEGDTRVVYTSDHGDNLGTRGLWGKSTLYEESAAIPLILSGPGIEPGLCETPVDLLDLSTTIADTFGTRIPGVNGPRPLTEIAAAPTDPDREIISQYHAVGAVSGAFMLVRGPWKLIEYVGFAPELFNLSDDPEETRNLAGDPAHAATLTGLQAALRRHVDPDAANAQAFADQAELVRAFGGREAALRTGMAGATPPPKLPPELPSDARKGTVP